LFDCTNGKDKGNEGRKERGGWGMGRKFFSISRERCGQKEKKEAKRAIIVKELCRPKHLVKGEKARGKKTSDAAQKWTPKSRVEEGVGGKKGRAGRERIVHWYPN